MFNSLRDFMKTLESEHELVKVSDEVQPEPDIGAAGKAICETQGPAVLFEKVRGFEIPLVVGVHGSWDRASLALNLPKGSGLEAQMEIWNQAFQKYPVAAKVVSDGVCKENIVAGDRVNLLSLPVPRLNANDGSFYISKGAMITRDPDSDWLNVGLYRIMLLDKARGAIFLQPGSHAALHYKRCEDRNQPLEFAVALGNEPVLPMIAGARIPVMWNEFDYAGAVRGCPEELVPAEKMNVDVPANAEIILEGRILPHTRVLEGPFGEYTGAYSGYLLTPVVEIDTITHRDAPIFEHLYIGRPNTEPHYMTITCKLAGAFQELKRLFPNITKAAFQGPYLMNLVVQGRWSRSAEPKQVIHAWFGGIWRHAAKMITIVDEDVDPWNPFDVLWAIATRVQADKDLMIIPNSETFLDPSQDPPGVTCKLGIDATKPIGHHAQYIEEPENTEYWKTRITDLKKTLSGI